MKNWLEWLVFGVSALLLLSVLGYLIYDAVRLGSEPPAIEITLGNARPSGEQFMIPVRVYNAGDRAAEGVLVEVALMRGDEELEAAEFEAAFVPRNSTSNGWVVFTIDPTMADTIDARVLGYQQP